MTATTSVGTLELRVLGAMEADVDGRPARLGGPKQRVVLATLVANSGRRVATEALIDAVYQDQAPRGARRSIQTYVSNLRSLLGEVITARSGGYVLEVGRDRVDAMRFEDEVAEALGLLDDEAETAGDRLEHALALWRGHAYADVDSGPELLAEISRLSELRLTALEARIEADLARSRHEQLVAELEALATEYPYRERFRQQHMLALYRSGRQAEALRAYRQTETTLVEELGIDPSPELQELEQRILVQDEELLLRRRPRVGRRALLAVDVDRDLLTEAVPPERRVPLMVETDTAIERAITRHGGRIYAQRLNATFAEFGNVADAVAAASGVIGDSPSLATADQRKLVRAAVDAGDVEPGRDGTLAGPAVTRSVSLVGMAHAGQVLLSADAQSDAALGRNLTIKSLGTMPIPLLDREEPVFQVVVDGEPAAFPPPRSDTVASPGGHRIMPGYELREAVARGAGWVTWRAYQPSVGREVAVKVIDQTKSSDPEFVRRFELEALTVARLEHPHIVPLFDYWRDAHGAYLVSRWVSGGTLAAAVRQGPLDTAAVTRLVVEGGSALAAAHRAGVAHRQLDAKRILRDTEGAFYITDFGVADLAGEGRSKPRSMVANDISDFVSVLHHAAAGGPAADIVARLDGKSIADMEELLAVWPSLAGSQDELHLIRTTARNPYRGLDAFSRADAADFHGRDVFLGELVAAVESHRFAAVVGPSGVGKSSVVHAGLLPALMADAVAGSSRWFVATMTPGHDPFAAFAAALRSLAIVPDAHVVDDAAHGARSLVEGVRRAVADEATALVVIDQFEELFTLTSDAALRNRFLEALVALVASPDVDVRVVVTIRADLFERPLAHPLFGELLSSRTLLLSPPSPDELRDMIELPAQGVGVAFAPELVGRILSDVDDEPGALPMVEYALTEMFDRRRSDVIDASVYEEMGGVLGALGRRAEAIFASLTTEEAVAARQLFLRLVTVTEAEKPVRRRARRSELDKLDIERTQLDLVIQRFGAHRLLTFDRDPVTRSPTVEVAHEAIFSAWDRLAKWIDERRRDLAGRRRLVDAVVEWERSGRDPGMLLTGSRAPRYAEWAATTDLSLASGERQFIAASVEQQAAASRRQARIRNVALAGVSAAAVIAIVFALVASGSARRNRALAADALVGDARYHLSTGEVEEAALALSESFRLDDTLRPYSAMGEIVNGHEIWGRSLAHLDGATAVKVAAHWDDGVAAFAGDNPQVPIVDVITGEIMNELQAGAPVGAIAFLADGRLVTGDDSGLVSLWDPGTGDEVTSGYDMGVAISDVAPVGDNIVMASTFKPAGDQSSRVSVLRLTDDREWEVVRDLDIDGMTTDDGVSLSGFVEITDVLLAPDGERVITSGSPTLVAAWDLESGVQLAQNIGVEVDLTSTRPARAAVWQAVFSPDGRFLVTGHQDRTLLVRDASTLQPLGLPTAPVGGQQRSLNFTPAGDGVISSGQEGVLVWDFSPDGELGTTPAVIGQTSELNTHGHALSPDGHTLLVAVTDRVRAYNLYRGQMPLPAGMDDTFRALVVDGATTWLGGHGGVVHRWDRVSGEVTSFDVEASVVVAMAPSPVGDEVLFGTDGGVLGRAGPGGVSSFIAHENGQVWAVAWNPSGTHVATASVDNTVVVWDAQTWEPAAGPFGPSTSGGTVGLKAVAFLDDDTLATTGGDGHLRTWDAVTGTELLDLAIVDNQLNAVAAITDALVAVGDELGTITVVDVSSGEIVASIDAHSAAVRTLALAPDGATLASGGQDNTVRLFHVESWNQLGLFRHAAAVRAVGFTEDGAAVVAADTAGEAVVWDADWRSWPERVCRWLDGWDLESSWERVMGEASFDPACDAG